MRKKIQLNLESLYIHISESPRIFIHFWVHHRLFFLLFRPCALPLCCAVLCCVGSALLQVHASLLSPTFSRGKKRVRFARESTTLLFHHKQLDLYRHVVCVYTHSRFSPTPAAGNRRNNKTATREPWLAGPSISIHISPQSNSSPFRPDVRLEFHRLQQ